MSESNSYKDYSWRDLRYHHFYQVADTVVEDIQDLVWKTTGKTKRRLKGNQLEKLTYSVEKLVRDSLAIVMGRDVIPNCPTLKALHHT
tara:strand:+ start:204 stop:467 length:264 start_codon:yes stop_codon:yes gene_type:complete